MTHDVVVVGGGIGGLTTAALLAARGLDVCLVERGSRVGGCAASYEHAGYSFEQGAGLYAAWHGGGVHERVFAELGVTPPEAREVVPAYAVRLPDGAEVLVGGPAEEFERRLRAAFPECAGRAVEFYRAALPLADALQRAAERLPSLATVSRLERMRLLAREARLSSRVLAAMGRTAADELAGVSVRFRRFVDAQLSIFSQRGADDCAYLYAAVALAQPLRGMHALRGGGQGLADALAASIVKGGGSLRLNATALRLAFDSAGRAAGVDLLSGERVAARRAVVSNLTAWDTYGKLVGHEHTPADVRARLKRVRGWGAYLVFLALEETAAARLAAEHTLAVTSLQEGEPYDPAASQLMLSAAPAWDARAPAGMRAATLCAFTEAEGWFSFHTDDEEHEARDQSLLETLWGRLHRSMPELGAGVEVIETATPRDFYERTRRRLGMVGGVGQSLDLFGPNSLTHRTPVPGLLMVGDTVFPGNGVAAVTHSALAAANEIAPPRSSR
jgi:C-3',4' desaturase CrtD